MTTKKFIPFTYNSNISTGWEDFRDLSAITIFLGLLVIYFSHVVGNNIEDLPSATTKTTLYTSESILSGEQPPDKILFIFSNEKVVTYKLNLDEME